MYQIKPKRPGSFLYALVCVLCIAAVGMGIGYASIRLLGSSSKEELISQLTSPIPEQTAVPYEEPAEEVVAPKTDEIITNDNEFMYLVKLEDGKTKVYNLSGKNKIFSHQLPVEPGSIPPSDLNSLKEGIYLKDKEALLSFTEDFCS